MEENRPKPDLSALRISKEKRYEDRPRSKAWRWLGLAALLAVVVVGFLIFRSSVTPAAKIKVGIATQISGSDAAASLVATGYVVAQRKAEVASKGTGRLVKLDYEEGDTIKAGAVIAVLDNQDIQANLLVARAQLERAKVDTLNAGRAYRRYQSLAETGAVTTAELETAESNYKTALAAAAGAAAAVTTAEVNLENTYIRAPFAGTILTKNAEVGEIVAPFASSASSKGSVVTLADMTSLEVEADVSEANINRVQVGQPAEIVLDAYPTVRYAALVKKIVPTADRSRATVLTKVAFRQIDEKVLPEMSARVNFFLDTTAASSANATMLAIPRDAVTSRDGQKVVFRIEGESVTQVSIQTGRELGKMVEILSGLTAGDRVVLSPPGKMITGQKIEITS
ncbi:MAG: efflux RND transporter periplasmic adaptor subunit [candidate division Zixibacteria bacterium]|nr:efflux RND transporter periplasmic adaptor subunit [candidate division Zixibacteria bacterium]